ncbi:MAG: hypothetical protein J6U05_03280, partial [Neisseriaceae bacterium]|nr:hypothetical protein [Neisseriaceae bacterium]
FCDTPLYLIGYLKIIFNFASLVKNNFQRLPRLTLVRLAMTIKVSGSLKTVEALSKIYPSSHRLDDTFNYSFLTAH